MGRRGPLQAAFTIAELREMLKLENCKTIWRSEDFEGVKNIVSSLQRPRKRIAELMLKSVNEMSSSIGSKSDKSFRPIFLRSPLEFSGTNSVRRVQCSVNHLTGNDILKQSAKATERRESFDCGLAVRSIGYKSIQIDPSVPFDSENGRIINSFGKVGQNMYAAGWVATGPIGVILSTMTNAFQVGKLLSQEVMNNNEKGGTNFLKKILETRGVQTVSYTDWEKIDAEECKRGKSLGKPREKIVNIQEMLEVARR